MALRETLRKFIIIACNSVKVNACENLSTFLDDAEQNYNLSALSDDAEKNYKIFWRFVEKLSSTLLCMMVQQGVCANEQQLVRIIREVIELRRHFEHEEDDPMGIIADFLRRNSDGERVIPIAIVNPQRREKRRRVEEEEPVAVPARKLKNNENELIKVDASVTDQAVSS